MVDRPKTELEMMGERLLRVVRDHAADSEPTIKLISDVAWALGHDVVADTIPARDPDFAEVEPPKPAIEGASRLAKAIGFRPRHGAIFPETDRYTVIAFPGWIGARPDDFEGWKVDWCPLVEAVDVG